MYALRKGTEINKGDLSLDKIAEVLNIKKEVQKRIIEEGVFKESKRL